MGEHTEDTSVIGRPPWGLVVARVRVAPDPSCGLSLPHDDPGMTGMLVVGVVARSAPGLLSCLKESISVKVSVFLCKLMHTFENALIDDYALACIPLANGDRPPQALLAP